MRRDQDFFWEGVDRGELVAQRCASCATLRHPPAPACARCGDMAWQPARLSGRGSVASWIVAQPPGGGPARIVVLVELEEGVRIVSGLCDGEPAAGLPVEVIFAERDGRRLPLVRAVRR